MLGLRRVERYSFEADPLLDTFIRTNNLILSLLSYFSCLLVLYTVH